MFPGAGDEERMPLVGDVLDSTLAGLARTGDEEAFVELVARHLDEAYDFALRLCLAEEPALEAVRSAVATAEFALSSLETFEDFRSWLLALIRPAALARAGTADPAAAFALGILDEDRLPIGFDPVEAGRLAPIVWRSASRLDPQQRLLLELGVRQDVSSAAMARVVGLSGANGDIILDRLAVTLGDRFGADLMVHEGRGRCRRLDAIAAREHGGDATRPVLDHVVSCRSCKRRWSDYPPLLDIYGALAIVPPSDTDRERILDGILDDWPEAKVLRQPVPLLAAPERKPATARTVRLMAALGLAAGGLAVALFAPFSPLSLTRGDDGVPGVAGPAGPADESPTADDLPAVLPPPATPTATVRPADGATASPVSTAGAIVHESSVPSTATVTPTQPPSPTPTVAPSPTPSPTISPTPTVTPVACVAPLRASNAVVAVPLGSPGSLTLINGPGCPETRFAVTVAGGTNWLKVSPAEGVVPAASSVQVTLTVDPAVLPPAEGASQVEVAIVGGAGPLAITVSTQRGGAPPSVVSTSVVCGGAAAAFSVVASDDVAVSSVSILFRNAAGDSRSIALLQAGEAWTGSTSAADVRGGSGFLAVAVDGASHTATSPLTLPASCR